MASQTASNSGIGFVGLLQIAFIVLKLIGKIDWSWWWVLAPIWGSFVFVFGISFGFYFIARALIWLDSIRGKGPSQPRAK